MRAGTRWPTEGNGPRCLGERKGSGTGTLEKPDVSDPHGVDLGSRCPSIQPMVPECPVVPALNWVPWGMQRQLTRALKDVLCGGGDIDTESNVEAMRRVV